MRGRKAPYAAMYPPDDGGIHVWRLLNGPEQEPVRPMPGLLFAAGWQVKRRVIYEGSDRTVTCAAASSKRKIRSSGEIRYAGGV